MSALPVVVRRTLPIVVPRTVPVVVLRPEPGNGATVERLQAAGIEAIAAPLFAIEPVTWSPPAAGCFDALLLTSANAVRMAGSGLAALAGIPVWCVGEATATAARAAGLAVARTGQRGVAAVVGESGWCSQRLLWLCGEERSAVPADSAVQVTAIAVYRTRELAVPTDALSMPCIALLHSSRAARRLAALAPVHTRVTIIAISTVVAAAAGDGWGMIAVASRPDDAEMVAIAAELCQKHG